MDRPSESSGNQGVIRGNQQAILPGHPLQTLVERCNVAQVDRMVAVFHAMVLGDELLGDFIGIVGRGVVDDQDTEIHGLAQNTFNALSQKVPVIVAWNNEIDSTHG
jgi:hypothetical protein